METQVNFTVLYVYVGPWYRQRQQQKGKEKESSGLDKQFIQICYQ